MDFFLNYVLAWVTVLLGVFLSLKYFIRKLATGNGKHKVFFQKLNKSSRKSHIALGVLVCITGLVHGIYSGEKVLSLNIGTVLWITTVLLGLSYGVRKLFKSGKTWLIIHRFLTVAFLMLIVVHILDVGGINIFNEINYMQSSKNETRTIIAQSSSSQAPAVASSQSQTSQLSAESASVSQEDNTAQTPQPSTSAAESEKNSLDEYNANLFGVMLKDGTYTGVANGYGPDLTVEVAILNNNVTSITIASHNEHNAKFYATPMQQIPASIIDKQSLEVDTITGATFTSVGIINAVNEALSQAVVSGELPKMLSLPANRGH